MGNTRLDQTVEALRQDMVSTLQQWIRVPSLKADPAPGAPFGPEIRRMLDVAMADGKRLGFAPRDVDGYACDMEIGTGEEVIGILAHLDVVPAGEGWTHGPFDPVIVDGKLYGRGTGDDKGPAIAAMYAMKAVRDAGVSLKKRVRLILGCDEESGWGCMDYYKAKIGLPEVGFSPDACYPLINTEKGICRLDLATQLPAEGPGNRPVYRLHAGTRPNVIPSAAEAEIGGDFAENREACRDFAQRTGYPIQVTELPDGHTHILVDGVGGHASMPELGQNAAAHLLQLLHALEAGTDCHAHIDLLAQCIGGDTDGTGFGIAGSDGVSGPLTINLGLLNLQDGELRLTLDIRYPVMFDAEQIARFVAMRMEPLGITVQGGHGQLPHHVPETSSLVRTLLSCYHTVTGLPPTTLAIGGGTYARALKEGVAFGCVFPGEEELAHQADEYIVLESLMTSVRIFAHAIVALAG